MKWNKIFWMKEALGHADWVLWVDADAYLMDHSAVTLQKLAAEAPADKHLICSTDVNGPCNLGAFLLRSSSWSKGILDEAWEIRDQIQKPDPETKKPQEAWIIDQAAIGIMNKNKAFAEHLWVVPGERIQGYSYKYNDGRWGWLKYMAMWHEGVPVSHNIQCYDDCSNKTKEILAKVKQCKK